MSQLVLSRRGREVLLDSMLRSAPPVILAGLFTLDAVLDEDMTLARLAPASFSGYGGVQNLGVWGSVVTIGARAVTESGVLSWTHDGGPRQDWIYGYYVINDSGELLWAAKSSEGAIMMNTAGRTCSVVPRFSFRSEFTEG